MSFYPSLKIVHDNTGIEMEELLSNQLGFKANPSSCLCGHEWNMFDLVIEAVNKSGHGWSFFNTHLIGKFGGFFYREFDMTCRCGITTKNVGMLYKYKQSHALGWY
jgi:hypothetical protein